MFDRVLEQSADGVLLCKKAGMPDVVVDDPVQIQRLRARYAVVPFEPQGTSREQMVASLYAMKLASLHLGILSGIEASIAGDSEAQLAWQYAPEFRRLGEPWGRIAHLAGLDDDQQDTLFRAALEI